MKNHSPFPEIRIDSDSQKPVRLFLGEDSLQVDGGKAFRYVPIRQKNQRDYAYERKRAAQFLIENQGQVVRQEKLWQGIYDDTRHYDAPTMHRVKSWLERVGIGDFFLFRCIQVERAETVYFVAPQFRVELDASNCAVVADQPQVQELGQLALYS